MPCAELMKTDPVTITPEVSVQAAASLMRDAGIGFLPVCDADGTGTVLGTITDRDLAIRVLAQALPANTPIGNCMTKDVVKCDPTDDIREAELQMAHAKVSRILCIDEATDQLVGVISLSDIAQYEAGARAASTLRAVSSRETH